ncbi:MAG: sugar phosphate nucleotidyltransferase [Candidatus Bathyarchaeia archaeon]
MKVVLFCGGLGMRLYPTTENIPKPLVLVGEKPMIWHLMKYYAYFGHKEFILCLGYKGEQIKKYFLNYDECLANDFVLSQGGKKRQILKSDLEDWRITFVETGLSSNIGQRLKAVQKLVEGEKSFFANYTDAVTDFYLPNLVDFFAKHKKIGCFLAVKPYSSFHVVSLHADRSVKSISPACDSNIWINGGFFIFKNEIFNYINEGEDLLAEPFQRLMDKNELAAYKYDGFWANLDTYKDKQQLDFLSSSDNAPWQIWKISK